MFCKITKYTWLSCSKYFMKKFNVVYYTLHYLTLMNLSTSVTAQKMKFSIKDFFSKNDQIRRFQRIESHLLKISLMENFIFCAVWANARLFLTYSITSMGCIINANILQDHYFNMANNRVVWLLLQYFLFTDIYTNFFVVVSLTRSKKHPCRSSISIKLLWNLLLKLHFGMGVLL